MGRETQKSNKSTKGGYLKVINDDLASFKEFAEEDEVITTGPSSKPKSGKREHEIYDRTYYIPNSKLRLLEIPMNSNLFF